VTTAVERFGVRREVAAFGGAALAFVAAQHARGATRAVLGGAVVAGLGLGVAELLRKLRQDSHDRAQRNADGPQPTPPGDAVTRSDLDQAMAELRTRNAAALAEREQAREGQLREMENMVRDLTERLQVANAENERLRAAEGDDCPARISDGPGPVAERVASFEAPASSSLPLVETPSLASPSDIETVEKRVEHFRALYTLLDEHERRRLSNLIATLSKDALASVEAHLLAMTPTAGVGYLRHEVFPSVRLAS
jgi:hypothetical protein